MRIEPRPRPESASPAPALRAVVIGGGVSVLAAALRLAHARAGPPEDAALAGALVGLVPVGIALLAGWRLGGAFAAALAGLALALDGHAVARHASDTSSAALVVLLLVAVERLAASREAVRAGRAAGALAVAALAGGSAAALVALRGAHGSVPASGPALADRLAVPAPESLAVAAALALVVIGGVRTARWPGLSTGRAIALAAVTTACAIVPSMIVTAERGRAASERPAVEQTHAVRVGLLVAPPPPPVSAAAEARRASSTVLRVLTSAPGPVERPWSVLLAAVVLGLAVGGAGGARRTSGALLLVAAIVLPGFLAGVPFAVRHAALLALVPVAAAGWSGASRVPLPRLRRRLAAGAFAAALLAAAGAAAWSANRGPDGAVDASWPRVPGAAVAPLLS